MRIIITEEQKNKLFIPRKLSGEGSRWSDWNNQQPIVDGIRINQYDPEGNKTGYWETYYNNGKIHSKGNYINGKREGIWECYWSDDKLWFKGNYINDKREGYWVFYFPNGSLSSKTLYKDDETIKELPITESEDKKKLFIPRKLSGEGSRWSDWNKEQPIKDGKRINQYDLEGREQGYWEYYYDNGNIMEKGSYKNGKEDGLWKQYFFSNGQLSSKGGFKNGDKYGLWEYYWENGQLGGEGNFKNDYKDGIWKYYNEDGVLRFKRLHKDGETKELPITESEDKKKLFIPRKLSGEGSRWSDWNKEQPIKDGIRINQYNMDGKKDGIWEYYWDNGILEGKGNYKNDLRDGLWEEYFSDGKLRYRGNYKNDLRDGIWEFYHENGKLYCKGLYNDGSQNALWEFYHENGQLHRKITYINDQMDGLWEYYSKSGKLESKGYYTNGEKDGLWERYWENGRLSSKGNYNNGYKDGIWDYYNVNGKLWSKQLYKDDEMIKILPLTESKKLFIPRKLSGEGSRWSDWNNMQPIKDGVRINQYDLDGRKQGYWEEYDSTNTYLNAKGHYKNNLRDGLWEFYYENGQLSSKGSFKNGKRDGIWEEYFSDGDFWYEGEWDNGKYIRDIRI